MASLVTDNDDTTTTTSDNSTINTFVSTISHNENLSKGYENLTQQAKKQAIERIVAMANFELTNLRLLVNFDILKIYLVYYKYAVEQIKSEVLYHILKMIYWQ